jgi:hypothetical protein
MSQPHQLGADGLPHHTRTQDADLHVCLSLSGKILSVAVTSPHMCLAF